MVEQYLGKKFEPFRPLPAWEFKDFLGWHEQGDGKLFYGIFVSNGRLKGEAKKAMRRVIERYSLPVVLTPNQNIILADVEPAWKGDIEAQLKAAGIKSHEEIDSIDRLSMACPALPLCGLAVTEAERSLPDINARIRALMVKVGLPTDAFHVRMTGCPNGCARPYMAELGFVGDGPNSYQVWLGGSSNQTRLAEVYQERVKIQDLEKVLEPVLVSSGRRRREQSCPGPPDLTEPYPGPRRHISSRAGRGRRRPSATLWAASACRLSASTPSTPPPEPLPRILQLTCRSIGPCPPSPL